MISVCRLCAALRQKANMICIQENTQQMLQQVLDLELNPHDNMPRCICKECMQLVEKFYNFYLKVQSNQETLRKLYITTPAAKQESQQLDESAVLLKQALQQLHNEEQAKDEQQSDNNNDDSQQQEVATTAQQQSSYETVQQIDDDDDEDEEQCLDMAFTIVAFDETEAELLEATEAEAVEAQTNDIADIVDLDEMQEDLPEEQALADCNIISDITQWQQYAWYCAQCIDCYFETRNLLQQHMLSKHHLQKDQQQMLYKCQHCLKTCQHYHTFLNHVRFRHCQKLSLNCDGCDQQFVDFLALKKHRFRCKQAFLALETCEKCGKCFAHANALLIHMRNVHGSQQNAQIWQCSICPKQLKNANSLRAHERLHKDEKRHICDICQSGFHTKAYLDHHLLSHSKTPQFQCSICYKQFKSLQTWQQHNLTHSEQPKFKCDYCPNVFRTKGAKLSHERTHSGQKPYKCEFCDKTFRYRSVLHCHRNTHTGHRPHKCNECERSFTNWPNWNKHMKRMHSDKSTNAKQKIVSENTTVAVRYKYHNDDDSESISFERCFEEEQQQFTDEIKNITFEYAENSMDF